MRTEAGSAAANQPADRRLLWTVALLMMMIGHTCPGDAIIRRVVFSVYVPLLFFLFGAEDGERTEVDKGADSTNRKERKGARRKLIGREIIGEARRLLLPLVVVSAIPWWIDLLRERLSAGQILEHIRGWAKAVFWMSGVGTESYDGIGVLWFLGALFWASLVYRGIRRCLGQPAAGIACLAGAAGAMALARKEIWLPLALDTGMAGLFFYGAGDLWRKYRHRFVRLRYPVLLLGLAGWVYCLYRNVYLEMAPRIYMHPIVFPEALAGIFLLAWLTGGVGRLLPRITRVAGIFGCYPLAYICMHHLDGFLALWWSRDSWQASFLLRTLVTGCAVLCLLLIRQRLLHGTNGEADARLARIREAYRGHRRLFDGLCYIAFAIVYAKTFFNTTMFYMLVRDWTWLDRPYWFAIGVLCVLGSLALSCVESRWQFFLETALLLTGWAYWMRGGILEVFALCVLLVALTDRRFRPVLRISLVIGCLFMIAAYEASMQGYIPYLVYETGGELLSHAFGILYRTDFGAHVLFLVMTYVVLRGSRLTYAEYLIEWFVTWLVWRYSAARMNTACLVLFLTGYGVLRLYAMAKKKDLRLPRWSALIHPFCALGVYLIVFLMNADILPQALGSLGARLNLSLQAFREYPPRLFGCNIPERGAGGIPDTSVPYFYLDISYVRILLIYGILLMLLYLLIMGRASRRSAEDGAVYLALALMVVAIHSTIEHHTMEICYDVFILSAFTAPFTGRGEALLTKNR